MKIRVTALAASLAALVLAAPALAKGPSEAKVSGPGLQGGGIHLKSDGGGDPSSCTPLGDLTEFSGFFPALFGQMPDPMRTKRPTSKLGPKYTIEYTVPGPNGDAATIRQDLFHMRSRPRSRTRSRVSGSSGTTTRTAAGSRRRPT
jgi:hypothetical protein